MPALVLADREETPVIRKHPTGYGQNGAVSNMGTKGTRNEITLEGRLGKDPELKHIGAKQTALCQFSIATTESMGGDSEKTIWHDVKIWQKLAEAVAGQIEKGDTICVTGYLDVEEWDDKETGKKRRKSVIVARSAYKKIWPKRDAAPADERAVTSRSDTRARPADPENDPADRYADESDVTL